MFGGIAWMVNGNMACGTLGENLMVRLAPDDAEVEADDVVERPATGADAAQREARGGEVDPARRAD